MTQELLALTTLPLPSTDVDEVVLVDERGRVTIRYTVEDGEAGQFAFDRVRSYRRRAESHCLPWHLRAYDTLVEVEPSDWVEELRSAMPVDLRAMFELHHFMIYFDSYGCYEVVARSWSHRPAGVAGQEGAR